MTSGKKSSGAEIEKVIRHIQREIASGHLAPGDKLHAERKLAADVGVSRAQVRQALERLEFYGVIRTFPQSGSVLADHSPSAMVNQISNMLEVESFDFYSLVSVRVLLEAEAIRLCAQNRTEEDLAALKEALADFEKHVETDLRDEKDFAYHTAIAKASHNPVIASLLLVITPQVLEYYRKLKACTVTAGQVTLEHRAMLECIAEKNSDKAEKCIREHFQAISGFAEEHRGTIPRTRL